MERFITWIENNPYNAREYSKMRKYTRDIEERYPKDVTLKSMIKEHTGLKLEGMDKVNDRIQDQEQKFFQGFRR